MTVVSAVNALPSPVVVAEKPSLLSRLNFFTRPPIAHPIFGSMRRWRGGNYLRGHIQLGGRAVRLIVRRHENHPTTVQERAYFHIRQRWAAMLPTVLDGLLPEYTNVRALYPKTPWPAVTDAAKLLEIIPLNAIWLEEGPDEPFVLSFRSSLDKDHEFHVFFRGGSLRNIAFEH